VYKQNDDGSPFANGNYETTNLLPNFTHSLIMRCEIDKKY
jgi:hypothetical protein